MLDVTLPGLMGLDDALVHAERRAGVLLVRGRWIRTIRGVALYMSEVVSEERRGGTPVVAPVVYPSKHFHQSDRLF